MRIIKNSRTHQVLKLLSDGKVHKTNELPLPPKTRAWLTSQAEDRHNWFWRATKKGYVEKVSKMNEIPSKWRITEKGKEVLGKVK